MCLGGGGGGDVTSEVKLPPHITEFSKELLPQAREVAERPYAPYPGPRVADFTPDTEAGFDMTRQNLGAWVPHMNAASGVAGDVASPNVNVAPYMDPFLQQVVDRAMSETNRQADIERNKLKGVMASADAYGGARHGVQEAELTRNVQDLKQNLIAQLLSGGYQQSLGHMLSDKGLRLDAAGTLAGLGETGSRLGYGDAAAMLDIGDQQRARAQQGLDVSYQDFLRQFGYPQEMIAFLNAAISSQPYATTTVQSGADSGNTAAQLLGGLGAFAGGVGSLYGGFKSSKDFKKDDAPAAAILEALKTLPVRSWRYRPEMGMGDDRHIGPYAEDWQATFGSGDGKVIPIVDAIGINLQATKELAHIVDKALEAR